MTTAGLAYVNARIRGRKGGRLRRDDLVRLAIADTPSVFIPGWHDVGVRDDAEPVLALVYQRLVVEYQMALRVCPEARDPLLALIGLHEIENVKLAWRAIAAHSPRSAWLPAWRPLGALATIDRDSCAAAATLRALVGVFEGTPYGPVAAAALRAHADDPAAAEMALDRSATSRLREAIDRLPAREAAARELLTVVAGEREAAATIRAGRQPPIAIAQLRTRRRVQSRRAFERTPYSLAPLCAYVLMCEDELRGLLTVAEARARRLGAAAVRRALDAMR